MSETQFAPYPTSKIVQFNVAPFELTIDAFALCEDGSVWEFYGDRLKDKGYRLMSAPPSQPAKATQSDLDEALHALRNVIDNLEVPWGKTHEYAVNLRNAALEILRKHGA